MIIEKEKGFWKRADEKDVQAIVCTTCNIIKSDGSLVMGAGCARAFSETFPMLSKNWGMVVQGIAEGGNSDYHIVLDGPRRWNNDAIYVIGLQTKRHWKDPSDIELIVESCKRLKNLADILHLQSIICPAFGCGFGGLNFKDVEKRISKILDDRFTVISLSSDGAV
jgi:O-acetyl-ADP-ribose deacetylase (regulator of RNase III)